MWRTFNMSDNCNFYFTFTKFWMVIIYWDWPTLTSIMFYRPKFHIPKKEDKTARFFNTVTQFSCSDTYICVSLIHICTYAAVLPNSLIIPPSCGKWRTYILTPDHNKQINKSKTIIGLISGVVELGLRPGSKGYRTQPSDCSLKNIWRVKLEL